MPKTEQINDLIGRELSALLAKESLVPDSLVTIARVDCSPDLKNAKIFISVLPAGLSGTALKILRKSSSKFSKYLLKNTRLRKIPRFNWVFDPTEKNAGELENLLNRIKKENL